MDEVDLDPEGAGPAGDLLRRDARRTRRRARSWTSSRPARARSTTRTRRRRTSTAIKFWKTPFADCGNGKTDCIDYTQVAAGLDRDQGLRLGSSGRRQGGPPLEGGPPAAFRPRSGGGPGCGRRALLAPPRAAFLLVYIAALGVLFISAFWTRQHLHRRRSSTSGTWTTSGRSGRPHLPADRAAGRSGSPPRSPSPTPCWRSRSPTSWRASPAPQLRTAAVRAGAAAALVELPRPHLRVAADPRQRRRPQLVAGKLGLPDQHLALHELGDVDRLHVHLAAVHDPADLRGARADPGLVPRGLRRPRRPRLDDLPPRDPAAGAARGRRRLDLHLLADARRLHHADPRRQPAQFIGNVIYRNCSGSANNLPFAAAYATRAARGDGDLPDRSRGALGAFEAL